MVHKVYLAVPGKSFCWGTVTGVVASTNKHVAIPLNGGLGFSGVIDFNWTWTDAQNLFEEGRVTHYAMLHGDIEPHAEQRWLDILLDIMDEKDAELVSSVLPIKDGRGLTSSGICDPSNPWGAFRRFTLREIHEQLPETFNAEMAGYPDRPLLHNTGCWVADLRKPVFREVNADGSLKTLFRFPEKITRDAAGKWQHEQESEDWLLSRELWERGARNTWITRKVKLTHHGVMSWQNWKPYGSYLHGDEETAWRWREDTSAGPLSLVQMLEFELGSKCNLGKVHGECPNTHRERYGTLDTSRELNDELIVSCAIQAYRELGFTGLVGWIYYNEPLLQADRMFRLMGQINAVVPEARFILWTNGTLIPEDCEQYRQFEQIVVSDYGDDSRRGMERLAAQKIHCTRIDGTLDDRLCQLATHEDSKPCLRPFVEFILDNHGNHHWCCYDWQGQGSLGNVFVDGLAKLANDWRAQLPAIAGDTMSDGAPAVCRTCSHKWDRYQQHDQRIVEQAKLWRRRLTREAQQVTP